jgi:hypothetical protein
MFRAAKFWVAFLIVATLCVSCSKRETTLDSSVERGKYLVTLAGCHDCHRPKIPGHNGMPIIDEARLLSGHPENLPPPSWSPSNMKEKGVAAVTNPFFDRVGGPVGRKLRNEFNLRQRNGYRRME